MLTADDFRLIVGQALVLVEQLYVHLPLKRAMHAADPAQRLRLLGRRADAVSEADFHHEMVAIFSQLRDLHTAYVLPAPYQTAVAYLPFRLGEHHHRGEPRYVVTQVKPGEEAPGFRVGVRVTHWNGTPIRRAVELNAEREAGSNPEARFACGLAAMTVRPLALSLPPDEEWVTVTYRAGRKAAERRFEWRVFTAPAPGGAADPPAAAGVAAGGPAAALLGLDAKAELERRARKLLFDPDAVDLARQVANRTAPGSGAAGPPIDFTRVSTLPDAFSFRTARTPSGTFGYVRVHTFHLPPPRTDEDFVREFRRILGLVPQDGLILDARGNGGGLILAGERSLQLLTPGRVEPERFHFIPTDLTRRLCRAVPDLAPWAASLDEAVATGAEFSHGFPLAPAGRYNDVGQVYQGPVVLVVDARCYSTTDMFAAGFQDHEVGTVLGTAGATGAGGANVWTHGLLQLLLAGPASPFRPLPGNASFNVAVRRCTRVGPRAGVLVEDLGVVPDVVHRMTRRDVLRGNADLINRAGELLQGMPRQRVAAAVARPPGGPVTAAVTTANVTRLDVLLDGRPYRTLDVADGTHAIDVSALNPAATVLELRGYRGDKLVASTRVGL